jgi:hypothetical protein
MTDRRVLRAIQLVLVCGHAGAREVRPAVCARAKASVFMRNPIDVAPAALWQAGCAWGACKHGARNVMPFAHQETAIGTQQP